MTDWENLFRPEDFDTKPDDDVTVGWPQELMAKKANAILRKHLSEAPVVYGRLDRLSIRGWLGSGPWLSEQFPLEDKDTHKARLVCIEEIK